MFLHHFKLAQLQISEKLVEGEMRHHGLCNVMFRGLKIELTIFTQVHRYSVT